MLCFPASSPHAVSPKRGLFFKTYLVFHNFSQHFLNILNPKVLYDNCSFELKDVRCRTNRGRRLLSYMRIVVIFHSSVKGLRARNYFDLQSCWVNKTSMQPAQSHVSLFQNPHSFPSPDILIQSPKRKCFSRLFMFEREVQKHLRFFRGPRI